MRNGRTISRNVTRGIALQRPLRPVDQSVWALSVGSLLLLLALLFGSLG